MLKETNLPFLILLYINEEICYEHQTREVTNLQYQISSLQYQVTSLRHQIYEWLRKTNFFFFSILLYINEAIYYEHQVQYLITHSIDSRVNIKKRIFHDSALR